MLDIMQSGVATGKPACAPRVCTKLAHAPKMGQATTRPRRCTHQAVPKPHQIAGTVHAL